MATLTEEVRRRYSESFLTEITNPGAKGDVQISEDRLQAAAEDAEAEFLVQVGTPFDATNHAHVYAAVQGTLFFLHQYSGLNTDAMARALERWKAQTSALSVRIGERRRLVPVSSSNLAQSSERSGTRPDFDRTRFDQLVPDLPGSSTDADDDAG